MQVSEGKQANSTRGAVVFQRVCHFFVAHLKGSAYAIELMRIFLALAVLVESIGSMPYLSVFYKYMTHFPHERTAMLLNWVFHGGSRSQISSFGLLCFLYLVIAISAVLLLFGKWSRLAKILVFIGLLFEHALFKFMMNSGNNLMLAMSFLLLFAPLGRCWALDAMNPLKESYRASTKMLDLRFVQLRTSIVCFLAQLQIVVVYSFSGLDKLRSPLWRSGDAVWATVVSSEYPISPESLLLFASALPVLTYGIVALELSYWVTLLSRRMRPYLLGLALSFHIGVAVVMGLWAFSLTALAYHAAFFSSEWISGWYRRKGLIPQFS